jgi:hypothetical protein
MGRPGALRKTPQLDASSSNPCATKDGVRLIASVLILPLETLASCTILQTSNPRGRTLIIRNAQTIGVWA